MMTVYLCTTKGSQISVWLEMSVAAEIWISIPEALVNLRRTQCDLTHSVWLMIHFLYPQVCEPLFPPHFTLDGWHSYTIFTSSWNLLAFWQIHQPTSFFVSFPGLRCARAVYCDLLLIWNASQESMRDLPGMLSSGLGCVWNLKCRNVAGYRFLRAAQSQRTTSI